MISTSDPKAGKTRAKAPARPESGTPPRAPAKPAPKAKSSQRKIEANRANAKKSTGPKTTAGKARSAQNAVKHRLTSRRFWLADEERADYLARLEALYDEFRPLSEGEARLVDLAAMSLWRLFRVPAMEAELLEQARTGPAGEDVGLGAAFQQQEQTLGRLARYAANLQREMSRALAELRRVQSARRAAQRRALRGEDEWAPADFPLPFTAEGAENTDRRGWGMQNGAGAFTAEGAERAEGSGWGMQNSPGKFTAEGAENTDRRGWEAAGGPGSFTAEGAERGGWGVAQPPEHPARKVRTPGAQNEATAFTTENAEGAEEGPAADTRKEATASVGARRVSAMGDGGGAAGRKLSPEWHDYLHAEAERIRALAAQGLEGAPVPERGGNDGPAGDGYGAGG